MAVLRSLLFVPGNRPNMLEKAMGIPETKLVARLDFWNAGHADDFDSWDHVRPPFEISRTQLQGL